MKMTWLCGKNYVTHPVMGSKIVWQYTYYMEKDSFTDPTQLYTNKTDKCLC